MKHLTLCCLLGLFTIFCTEPIFSADSNLPRLSIGDQAPKLVSFDIFGATFNSNELLGEKLLLISFFGTYCMPCIAEFPEMIKLHVEYKSHLIVVMVNKGQEGREELKRFQNEHSLNDFYIVRDRFNKIGDPYGVQAVPVTIIVGKNGEVLYSQYGAFEEGDLYQTLSPIILGGMDE